MNTRRWLLAIWVCFITRAVFYSTALPVWEGFDEWSHFAVIQRMALRGEFLPWRYSPISRDIEASLKLAPLPWALRDAPPPAMTHDAYWHLPAEERRRREAQFHSLPRSWAREDGVGGLVAYEALQPPLYYWVAAPLLRSASNLDLGTEVLWLRWLSVMIASIVVPLSFLVGRSVFRSDSLALGCAAIIATMPEFMIDVARVGNECVAVVLFTLLTWLIVESVLTELHYLHALSIGVVFGLGLLTKAYFLTALPPVVLLLAYNFWRSRGKPFQAVSGTLIVASSSTVIAGWWYIRNLNTTGTLSGLGAATSLPGTSSEISILSRVAEIHWPVAIDAILLSHIWFGGWSSLTIRSWMYHLFYLVISVAAMGLVWLIRRPPIIALTAIHAIFWIGQLYNVLLLYSATGVATSMGWYMYAVVAAEVTLCIAGLRAISPVRWRRQVPLIGVLLFALLDLYTIHAVAIPYYTGMISHGTNGALVLHISRVEVSEIFTRLAAYKTGILSGSILLAFWAAYLVATVGLVVVSFACRSKTDVPCRGFGIEATANKSTSTGIPGW